MSNIFISAMVPMSESSNDILLVGGISAATLVLVVVVLITGCAVIIKIQKQKGKAGIKLVIFIYY